MAVYACLVVLSGVFIFIGVAAAHDRAEPKDWGTFTEESREVGGRGGDRVYGRWVSDDGDLVLIDVQLDGSVDGGERTRAYAQPTSLLGGDDVVHDGRWDWVSVVLPPIATVLPLLWLLYKAWEWGDIEALALRWASRK